MAQAQAQATAHPILPQPGKRNILITSALPYVNNYPHLGNIIGSVLSADAFSRFSKARGHPTLYICGTDEYGTVTETKALEEKITPEELCAKYRVLHAESYEWFNIGFDYFGKTPTQEQTDIAQHIFLKLHENGFLEERTTVQPYCESHKAFLADRFVEGTCPHCAYDDARGDQCDKCGKLLDALELINPRCKICNTSPIRKETKHTFLLLDKLQSEVEKFNTDASKKGAWSSNGIIITENWLKEGLKGRGITRDLKWGTKVPLPGYDDKVLYSWFDACIGYVSITAEYTKEWEQWWRNPDNVELYQFMGKDNVPFHTVVFPASQLGTREKWTMVHHLSTTEYLNYENGKFSKSRNIGVFGTNAKETGIPSDVWRYYLLSRRPENGDTEFEWKSFIDANNNELLKNLGNFVNRIVKYVNSKNFDSVVPDYTKYTEPGFDEWKADVDQVLRQYVAELEAVKIKAGLASALHVSSLGNKLLQMNTLDNRLAAEQPEKCAAVVGLALNLVHLLASVIAPYMPATCDSMLRQLNLPMLHIPDAWDPTTVPVGHRIGSAEYLFQQIKPEREKEWREAFGGQEAARQRAEKAAKAAARKADKQRKKEGKAAAVATSAAAPVSTGAEGDDVEAVAKGVEKASLQP